MSENCDVRFTSSSLKIPLSPPSLFSQTLGSRLTEATKSLIHLVNSFRTCSKPLNSFARRSPLLCSASLSLSLPAESTQLEVAAAQPKGQSYARHPREDEERVLISEVLVRNKDDEELERKDLEAEVVAALKACRPNSALTVREVQEVDTRDGIRLVFQVEPNQEFQGLVCEGVNVLPSKFLEDAFRDGYGKSQHEVKVQSCWL